jgi:hypothetical protein
MHDFSDDVFVRATERYDNFGMGANKKFINDTAKALAQTAAGNCWT